MRNLRRLAKAVGGTARERMAGSPGARQVALVVTPQADPNLNYTGAGAGWFGPGRPMDPTAPPEVAGRQWDFPTGYNMQQSPNAYKPITFEELRALADSWDLLRIIIEQRKDQMARQKWDIVPKEEEVDLDTKPELQARIKDYKKMLSRPNREQKWGPWLRALMEDLIVIDQPTFHVRRTLGGDVFSLDPIDGATIKPVLDDYGRRPEMPYAAYQQVLKGLPAINYNERDLIVRPRNKRTHKAHGYSPVEQIIMTVNIALRRQMWQLAYFTDGNIPDSLIGVPSTWTPDQIKQFQAWFDNLLSGNTQKRRGATFVPGEVAKSYVPTKEQEIFGGAEEWLVRVACFCIGVSPQPFLKMMNRATAETSVNEAIVDNLIPTMNWTEEMVNDFLEDEFLEEELEFRFIDDSEDDPKVKSEIIDTYVEGVVITRNEARKMLKLKPDASPEANILGKMTETGFVPLDSAEAIKAKKAMVEAFPPPPVAVPGQAQGVSNPKKDSKGSGGTAPPKGKDDESQSKDSSSSESLKVRKFAGADGHSCVHKAYKNSTESPLSVTRDSLSKPQSRLEKAINRAFSSLGESVADQTVAWLEGRVHKADEITVVVQQKDIDDFVNSLNMTELDILAVSAIAPLEAVGKDAAHLALIEVEADSPALLDTVNTKVVTYSRERAAELVGKRILEDGTIIDNPNAEWSLTESTRESIRETITKSVAANESTNDLAKTLENDYSFSPARAQTVARTEVAFANSDASMTSYAEAMSIGIKMKKYWLPDSEPCDICLENAKQGEIEMDQVFKSGQKASPAHPNCECAIVPVLDEEQ